MINHPTIIIVGPQMAENIGAVARCMKNFNLTSLRIVKPRCEWPDQKGFAMSAGADDVLHNAPVYENFQDAVKDLSYLYAATARKRYMNKDYITSHYLADDVIKKQHLGHSIGIIFGREANGLKNEEVNICNKILVIDNNESFSSFNIAQAACIVSYELFGVKKRQDLINKQELCSKGDLDQFFNHLIGDLDKKNFFKVDSKKDHMIQNIKNIFARVDNLSVSEVQTLRGIIATLSKPVIK
jgi:tRNA/rRNA methyltransferase